MFAKDLFHIRTEYLRDSADLKNGKNQLLSNTLFHAKAQSPQRKTKVIFLRILASLRLCERTFFVSGLPGLGVKR
jgi:hypothetical protein